MCGMSHHVEFILKDTAGLSDRFVLVRCRQILINALRTFVVFAIALLVMVSARASGGRTLSVSTYKLLNSCLS